jgi:hypothetical protein
MLKNDVAHGLTVSLPNRDALIMRAKTLKTRDLILSLSKDEAKISCFFSSLPAPPRATLRPAHRAQLKAAPR